MFYLAITWLLTAVGAAEFQPLHQRPLLTYAVAATLLGAQMMSIGFLAELMTAYLSKDQESYSVKETTPGAKPQATGDSGIRQC
jgi:hypothetical protein